MIIFMIYVHVSSYLLGCVLCKTFRQQCEAHIALKADDIGKALRVRSVCNDNNHELSKVC